jgi:hypothetical protein
MSLTTVAPSHTDHDVHAYGHHTKLITFTGGTFIRVEEITPPLGALDGDPLYKLNIPQESQNLYIRDALTQAIAKYLNSVASTSERERVTGSSRLIDNAKILREYIIENDVLYVRKPTLFHQLHVNYTLVNCSDPYFVKERRLTGLKCIGMIISVT